MTYNKPEVVGLDSALSAIQGMTKPLTTPDGQNAECTAGAYESDE